VQKGFPAGTKTFNWLFELFDGHGPHGELMSQLAAKLLPEILEEKLAEITTIFNA
jgi:serine/threonine protein phosphatase PrpC